jgi:heptosyltransferase-2
VPARQPGAAHRDAGSARSQPASEAGGLLSRRRVRAGEALAGKAFCCPGSRPGRHGYAVWLLGSAKDRPVGEEILDHASPGSLPLNLCGTTTLAQAIDLLGAASLVVCNDSGLMHVAAALGRRVVAVYGSSSPDFTPPLSEKATIISLNLACSPCFKRQCPLGHLDCLQQLEPQRVLAACLGGVAA